MIVKETDQLIVDGAGHRGIGGGHVPGPYRVYLGEATLIPNCVGGVTFTEDLNALLVVSAGCGVRASTGSWHRCRLFPDATTAFAASASATRAHPITSEAQELV